MRYLKSSEVEKLRNHLWKKQGGKCLICKNITYDPVLDHHHKKKIKGTGFIRGVLCRTCNVFLAKSENNTVRCGIPVENLPEILRSMADYLERKQIEVVHPTERKRQILQKSSYNKLITIYDGRAKIPPYKTSPKGKPMQKLTVKLKALFEKYNITPTYYK